MLINTVLITDKIIVNANAQPKFLILKSSINLSTSITKTVFTTIANNPKVSSVMGKVKNLSTGPRIKFANEIPAATQIAAQKFFISTPDNIFDVKKTAVLFMSQDKIIT